MQIGRELDDVHVLAVGAAQFFDVGDALGFGLGGDLVGVDGVDSGFGAHDGDAGLGQGQRRIGVEGGGLEILAPLQKLTKAEIVLLGTRLGVDYSLTRSCYDPGPDGRPCLSCDSCQLRMTGFRQAGMEDPLLARFAIR